MKIDELARRERAPMSVRLVKLLFVVSAASLSAACSTYSGAGPKVYATDDAASYEAASIKRDANGNEVASADDYVNPRDTGAPTWGRYSGASNQNGSSNGNQTYVYRGKQALGGPQ